MTHKKFYLKKLLLINVLMIYCASNVIAQSHLGPFEKQSRAVNPLREAIHFATQPMPAPLDYDKDGDIDIVITEYYGGNGFSLLRNDGTKLSPAYNYASSVLENPFLSSAYGLRSTPTFADLDNDGDADMLLGLQSGTFEYYLNTSSGISPYVLQSGAWNPSTKTGNPFYGIDLGDFTRPVFTDFDSDGDQDVIVGASYAPSNQSVYYYENDGSGNFSQKALAGINPSLDEVTPALIDIDGDGLRDIIVGSADGSIHFFKSNGTASYLEQTGNSNPFNGFNQGAHSAPITFDFDGDGDFDVIIAADNYDQNLSYFENKGSGVFTEKKGLDSPVGGINVDQEATSYFTDLDGDSSDELILSGFTDVKYYKKINSVYTEQAVNPFSTLTYNALLAPSLVDLDGDGDKDLVGGQDNNLNSDASIEYFRNDNGVFTLQDFTTGPFKDISINRGKSDFADVDSDGDFDFFISDWDDFNFISTIRFFKNTGTAQSPLFVEMTGAQNPLAQVSEKFALYPRFVDLDHDHDLDMVIGEGGNVVENADGNKFMYYENTGSVTTPQFVYRGQFLEQGSNPTNPASSFIDFDNDGDLDIFIGGQDGNLTYYKNTNPAASIAFSASSLTVSPNVKTLLDTQLALTDIDNDSISSVTISIVDFEPGKQNMAFSANSTINGSFDTNSGVLTFSGKETISAYQSLLRSVSFEYTDANVSSASKTIQASVRDADGTNSLVAQIAISINENDSGQVIVYNAVAPNSSGDNHFMRITNLPQSNRVAIFNRWGDQVYAVDNYDHSTPGKRFEGTNSHGKSLPTGTYFYKIEYDDVVKGKQELTGYLSLIQ